MSCRSERDLIGSLAGSGSGRLHCRKRPAEQTWLQGTRGWVHRESAGRAWTRSSSMPSGRLSVTSWRTVPEGGYAPVMAGRFVAVCQRVLFPIPERRERY